MTDDRDNDATKAPRRVWIYRPLEHDANGHIIPDAEDLDAVDRKYAKEHGKTAKEMLDLPDNEAAHLWRLAQARRLIRWYEQYERQQRYEQERGK